MIGCTLTCSSAGCITHNLFIGGYISHLIIFDIPQLGLQKLFLIDRLICALHFEISRTSIKFVMDYNERNNYDDIVSEIFIEIVITKVEKIWSVDYH